MKPILSAISQFFRNRQLTNRSTRTGRRKAPKRLQLEKLEDRMLMTVAVSVAGSIINEIGSPSAFVAPGSGGLSSPKDLVLGPDSNVYVVSSGTNSVIRYSGSTGQLLGTFVAAGSGGLSNPIGLAFGPDGNLYVDSDGTNAIYEYNGSTGGFLRTFVAAGADGLNNPYGLTFGADGNLYVASRLTQSIMRFEGPMASSPGAALPAAGQSGATFVPAESGGISLPLNLTFGPDGNLYVVGGGDYGVLRYNGTTGAFINEFVNYNDPADGYCAAGRGIAFDQQGRLYVGDTGNSVKRYDTQGKFLGDLLVGAVSDTLSKPVGLTFDAQGNLLISCGAFNSVVRYNAGVDVTLSAASSTPVTVSYAMMDGSALAGANYVADSGTVTFAPGQTSQMILLATKEDAQATGNVSFSVQLSNPTGGATIANGTATVNIIVANTTRQFSIANNSAIEGDTSAKYQGAFVQGAPESGFQNLTFGPDGNLYTTTAGGLGTNFVTEYNGATGALIGQFTGPAMVGNPVGVVFNGGYLYVCCGNGDINYQNVLQYNAATGAFVGVFVSGASGNLGGPNNVAFGPDANGNANADLYVSTSSGISRYNGTTGAYLGAYISNGSGGLSGAGAMTFDPTETYLYVTSSTNQVLKYNARTGAYVGVAASAGLSNPTDVKFGPDGLLYVLSSGNNRILRYTATGTYVDDYVPAGSDGMVNPVRMAFGPNGDLYVTDGGNSAAAAQNPADSQIFRFGPENDAIFTVTNTTPSTLPLTVNYATANGTAIAGRDYAATSGTLTFAPGITTATIAVPILSDGIAESGRNFTLNLSNPEGATLASSQAICSITDSNLPVTVTATPADWPSAGLTLTLGGDGNLHIYTTGTTTDAVPPVAPASVLNVVISSPGSTAANLTIASTAGKPVPPGGLTYSGGGGLIITGFGTVTLSGTNSYTGGTAVSAGTLLITAASALPDGTSLTVGAGAAAMFAQVQPASAAAPAMAASPTPMIGAAVPRIAARLPTPPHVAMSFAMSPAVIDAVFKSHRPAVGPADTSPESAVIRAGLPVIGATLPTPPPRFAALAAIESFWSSSDQDKPTGPEVAALDKVLARFGV